MQTNIDTSLKNGGDGGLVGRGERKTVMENSEEKMEKSSSNGILCINHRMMVAVLVCALFIRITLNI